MNINNDVKSISRYLTKKQKDFDRVMDTNREIIRDAAQVITALHNRDRGRATGLLNSAGRRVKQLRKLDLQFEYYTRQSYQEYAEARIFFDVVTRRAVTPYAKSGVGQEAYLLGLMDVMGELKREILEELREENVKRAEEYLRAMKSIYDGTRSLRFAEAVMSGFRRKQDIARIQLESASSEILAYRKRG